MSPVDVATHLHSLLQSSGLTQVQLAVRLSEILGRPVTQSRVSEWAAGKFIPAGDVVLAWQEACHRECE